MKEIKKNDVDIVWYYESYISNRRVFVMVKAKGKSDTAIDCNDNLITDIQLHKDTILVKMFNYNATMIYSYKKQVLGYFIKIDSTASYNDYLKIYHPENYKH